MATCCAPSTGRWATNAALVLAGLASVPALSAGNGNSPTPPVQPDVADMDITELVNVRVSPFDVSAHLDRGYRASNAVSASRFDAPVRELPFAIQAFTGAFIKDQTPRDI